MNLHHQRRDLRICVLVFPHKHPVNECGQNFLTQYLTILAPLVREVTVITGNYFPANLPGNVRIVNVYAPIVDSKNEPVFSQLFRLLVGQCTMSLALLKARKGIDIVNLYMWTGAVSLPVLCARLKNWKIWLTITGSAYYSAKKMYVSSFIPWFIGMIERSNYRLADTIFLAGAENMIKELHLEPYKSKIRPKMYSFYLDTGILSIRRGLAERDNIIGYIGRLSPEKGVMNFVQSIPLLLSARDDLSFIIVGDGPLMEEISQYLITSGCSDRVVHTGWVEAKFIPHYLNAMKIHVLASYTEALGGTNLEAMACGAISVVSNAGGLGDVVADGITGYVLQDNSPHTIADKIQEVLADPNLEQVQKNARAFIESTFDYDHVAGGWETVFGEVRANGD